MGEPRLILVVEDNPIVAMALEDALREAGFAVLAVESAREALAFIEQADELAAVVTDIRLETESGGWQVAERAREVHPGIAVVYISGHSAHLHDSHGVPSSRMLQKPFGRPQIVAAVTELIGGTPPARH
jgi:CheY-like chemotaxis protein